MTTVTRASMTVLFRYTVFGLLISNSKSETLHSYNLISSIFMEVEKVFTSLFSSVSYLKHSILCS